MRKSIFNVRYQISLFILAGLAVIGSLSLPAYAIDGVIFKFDQRNWKIGYQTSNARVSIVEYVLPGETVQTWTELITIQQFLDLPAKITPASLFQQMKTSMQQRCRQVDWKIIRKSKNAVLYQWRAIGCANIKDQHEIAKLQRNRNGLYRFAYVSKKVPLSREQYSLWRRLLGNARARD